MERLSSLATQKVPPLYQGQHGNPPGVAVTVSPRAIATDDRRERLEQLFQKSAARPQPKPESKLTRLVDYIRCNGPVKHRQLLRNWAQNHGVNAQTLDAMLESIAAFQNCRHFISGI